MPTQQEITDKVLRGLQYEADLVKTNVQQEQCANYINDWCLPVYISNLTQALTFKLQIQDYTSSQTLAIYNKLSMVLGMKYPDGITIDPNAQPIGGGKIIVIPNTGSTINSAKIPFTNATTISLSDYQSNYYPLYGNAPEVSIWVSDGMGGFNQDTGNVPNITYVVSGNISSGIQSIVWSYPVAASGYVQISGAQPSSPSL